MGEYVSVIFCRRCGSRYVEITKWADNKNAVVHCRTCNNKTELQGFTMGRCMVTRKELEIARNTTARSKEFEK